MFAEQQSKREAGDIMVSIDTSIIDAIGTNIMVADRNFNIIHMNPSVLALMREAEDDLRKELPHFTADRLIGQSIDVFHKNPQHQRQLLSRLTSRYSTTIRVGERAFDLRVSPVEVGYVVEWQDARPRLLNLDYEAQIKAIGRSQSIIEFGLDHCITRANENFLNIVGYSEQEVVGRPLGFFLDKDVTASPDYEEFWRRLEAGQFAGGQYRLNGRAGRTAWLEASFNPIFDHQGRLTKFVCFALDITQQIKLLTDLKVLIDENFGELDRLFDGLNGEAGQAAAAAQQTSQSVATVAAASEEFVASIQEISRNMYESLSATEQAVSETETAGQSTRELIAAVRAMDGVTLMIRKVANQINLLALNAAIEAAHAGEAGRGFAVVAQEVKSLAAQAARATEEISAEIRKVQDTTRNVSSALEAISTAVSTVKEHVAITSSALEEQSSVSQSMSSNMSSSAQAVDTVTANMHAIASAVTQAADALSRTREAAKVLVR